MKRLFLAVAALVALALPAAPAVAAPHSPTGEYAQFADCKLSVAATNSCLYAVTKGGSVTLGKKTVPIVNPVTLQGGGTLSTETGALNFYGAEDGNTLSKTSQPVPGGLLGITAPSWWPQLLKDLFNETINNGFTGVTATLELAAPASSVQVNLVNLLSRSGTALFLPVKVKLGNPFLGSSCYIGSNSSPIQLALTTGTTAPPPPNTPISGARGAFSQNPAGTILIADGTKLVNNSFSAPGANGCGGFLFSWLVDPFVDSIVGTPSPAGTNTAILENNRIELAERGPVEASEP
jgi:hypothetical protein